MRRHVALLVLIVAIVVAIALLRRPRPIESAVAAVPPFASPRIEEPKSIVEPDYDESAPRIPVVPTTKETAPKSEPTRPAPQPHQRACVITVVDADGVLVPDAVIFSVTHSYGNKGSESKVKEGRTDDKGEFKIETGRHDTLHFISYKVGVGSGITGEIRTDTDATLKYEKDLTVAFKCVAPHGVALEGADVILTTEILLGTRWDAWGNETAIVIPLAPRKILADRDGVSTFGAVLAPRQARSGWKAVPGICFRVTASWNTMTAQETIEKSPPNPVILVLQ